MYKRGDAGVVPGRNEHYFSRSLRPLPSLMFLLPLVVLYEIGVVVFQPTHVLARSYMEKLGSFSGAGAYLPGLAVVVVLLSWHFARRDRFEFDWRLYLAMGAESVALAIPLLMLGLVWSGEPAVATHGGGNGLYAKLVLSLGAGVYEELLFRLTAITLLHIVFVNVIGLKELTGGLLAVLCAAVLFASYHFGPGSPFAWSRFLFFVAAGAYLGAVFALRGFGIVAATHAIYDVFTFAIQHSMHD